MKLSLISKINIFIKLFSEINQIIILTIIINSIIFTQTNHPISIGLILLIQTLLTCLITGFSTKSFWFSYILFLIFIGGILILFIYIASLASNEKLNFSFSTFLKISPIIITIIFILLSDKFWLRPNFFNNELSNFLNFSILIKENFLSTSKIYDTPNNWIIIFLINYLLLNLIIIVKITNSFLGPLRAKN